MQPKADSGCPFAPKGLPLVEGIGQGTLSLEAAFAPLAWLTLVERELLLFAGVFFLIGAVDELAVDLVWLRLRLTGRIGTAAANRTALRARPLAGPAAVLVPAWHEHEVIPLMILNTLSAWPQRDLRLYIGCYANDPRTVEAAIGAAGNDPRVRLVLHGRAGPTTKADCLNRLYAAVEADERRQGVDYRMVVLHDAEDLVDPAALALLDEAIGEADFVQLPVLPEAQEQSRWIGSHYCEEFAEAHGKALPVRDALGAAIPAAGVGCAFARPLLARIAGMRGGSPFAVDSLTEDYELGLRTKALGGRSRFLRARGEDGHLVATRACFPDRLDHAVRQKARWVHGIALQGWDRLGWPDARANGALLDAWMQLRDRRSPMSALVLFAAYLLLVVSALVLLAGGGAHLDRLLAADPLLRVLLWINAASFMWRAVWRFAFTAREYGAWEGLRAVLRIPVSNVIAVMAGRRALFAYLATLGGAAPVWDKTAHRSLPVRPLPARSRPRRGAKVAERPA